MSYVTPAQLADGPEGLTELARLYVIDEALLSATINAGDRSAWSPAEIAASDAAFASLQDACDMATAETDARLAVRGYALPLSPGQFPVLRVWTGRIARYLINRNRNLGSEDKAGRIEVDYRDAIRALDLVAAGKLSLGAGDPLVPPAVGQDDAGAVRIAPGSRLFSRDTLGGL